MKVCLLLSGSVSAWKACALIGMLRKEGHEIRAVATKGALRFLGRSSLEALTGRPLISDMWAKRDDMAHIELRRWADLFLFYPATANRINALAAGLAPDIVGAAFLANNFEKPFWIAPAMNTGMILHPATVAALSRLESWGCAIIRGGEGRLACGDSGPGRLAEPEAVMALIRAEASRLAAARRPGPARRSLVTGGAMREDVDAVRSIVNTSSGRTATAIVRALLDSGWSVDFLHHEAMDASLAAGAELRTYRGYVDFSASALNLVSTRSYDAIVHAAAVSDYLPRLLDESGNPVEPSSIKLESGKPLSLSMLPTAKILPRLRERAAGRPLVCAFKLTAGAEASGGRAKAEAFLETGQADLVVLNDASGLGPDRHEFSILSLKDGAACDIASGSTNAELAGAILSALESMLERRIDGESSEPPSSGQGPRR